MKKYKGKEEIIEVICRIVGRGFHEIVSERGSVRQISMDMLYRLGGLKGTEIWGMMGIDYSTVSQGRKRLREKQKKNKKTQCAHEKNRIRFVNLKDLIII